MTTLQRYDGSELESPWDSENLNVSRYARCESDETADHSGSELANGRHRRVKAPIHLRREFSPVVGAYSLDNYRRR